MSCPVAGRLLVLAEAEPYILVTMEITLPKIAALMVALVQVGINLAEPGSSPGSLLGTVVWPGFCLSFIWFPQYYGSFTGYVGRGGMIDTETPPWLVAAVGWFLLVGLPVILRLVT